MRHRQKEFQLLRAHGTTTRNFPSLRSAVQEIMVPQGSRFEVQKFDGTGNFTLWQTRVKDLLAQQGCLKALRDSKPAKMDVDDWEELQIQAAGTIRLCLSDQVMYHVMDENSPKKVWEKLESQFMSKTATTKVYLKQKLYRLKMQEGSDFVEHMNAFNQVVTDLARLSVKIDDEDRAILLLCSLPQSYEHLITTLTYGKETIKVEDVTAALLSYDMRKKNTAKEVTHGEDFLVNCVQGKKGYEAWKNKKKKVQCHKCKKWGHIKKDCPDLSGGSSANVTTHGDGSDGSGDALLVSDTRSTKGEAWMLNSASSFHATPNREWFFSYKSGEIDTAYVGDDTGHHIAGVGDIKIKMFDGKERVLQGVRHVPGLRRNLISLGVLHDDGMVFRCDRDRKTMRIMKDEVTVMMGERTASHLYKLRGSTIAGGAMGSGVAGIAVVFHGGGGSGADTSGSSR